MRCTRHITTALAMVFAASAQLAAQNPAAATASSDQPAPAAPAVTAELPAVSNVAAQPMSFAPTEANARVGVHAPASSQQGPLAQEPPHVRHSIALMIVGGTILVVGAIIGGQPGTIIMIGGGTVGIIGLVRYLQ